MKQVYVKKRAEWRKWLSENCDKEPAGIWLVFYKQGTGKAALRYDDAVEEALCFGWIDSIIKKLDHEKYARKFTPRKTSSRWSALNKKRAEKMIESGQMTKPGLDKIEAAKKSGLWDKPVRAQMSFRMPPELEQALEQNPRAKAFFAGLAPSYRQQFMGWITVAKRPQTKKQRLKESLILLEQGKKLGLK